MIRALCSLLEKFRRDDRGAVMVEMTLITPLMLALSTGVFEFSNIIHQKLLIEAGLTDAARYYARCNPSMVATCAANAQNIAIYGTVATGTDARVAGWTTGMVSFGSTYTTTNNIAGDGTQDYRSNKATITTVRVTTSFAYTATSLLSYLGIGPFTITAAHEERAIGW